MIQPTTENRAIRLITLYRLLTRGWFDRDVICQTMRVGKRQLWRDIATLRRAGVQVICRERRVRIVGDPHNTTDAVAAFRTGR